MTRIVALAAMMAGIWFAWSGHTTTLLLALGAASVVGVVALTARLGILDAESVPIELGVRPQLYAPWLGLEIVKSNIDVARRVLSPRMPISPRVIRVRASQRTALGRTIYTNSITLTPGTVSIDVTGDTITVHALHRAAAESLEAGEMDRRVRAIEGSR